MAHENRFAWVKWVLMLGILGAGGFFGYKYWKKSSSKPPEYRTALATKGELTQVVTATGQLNAVTNVQVGTQISGIILKIYADYNAHVTNGQIIAEIDPSAYKAIVHQDEGDVASAKAALELAEVNAKRAH